MCPEIILSMDYDERADVWSFGILLGVLHTRQMYVLAAALSNELPLVGACEPMYLMCNFDAGHMWSTAL